MYRDPHQVSASIARQVRARASDALYVISVAARLVEMHPTTLRKYERVGFLEPSRTPGRTRLYSLEDIDRLRQIKRLVEEREMNLAGVQMALDLTNVLREIVTMIDQAVREGMSRVEGGLSHYDYKVRLGAREYSTLTFRIVSAKPVARARFALFSVLRNCWSYGYHKLWYRRVMPRLPRRFWEPQSERWLRIDF